MGGGTNLFLGVKAGATNKKTDIEGLSRITEVANPAISTDGNAIFQSLALEHFLNLKNFIYLPLFLIF